MQISNDILNKLNKVFDKIIKFYPDKKIFAFDSLLPKERETIGKLSKDIGCLDYKELLAEFGWIIISSDETKILRNMVVYKPGNEPDFIAGKIENMIALLKEYYPNNVIPVGLQKEHKKLSSTISGLYQWFGYASIKEFLAAYGYDYQVQQVSEFNRTTADELIKTLKARYDGKAKRIQILELIEDNPDLKKEIEYTKGVSNKHFNMTFKDYLLKEEILFDEEKYFFDNLNAIKEFYSNGKKANSIDEIFESGIVCKATKDEMQTYSKRFLLKELNSYLKDINILFNKKKSMEDELIDFETNASKTQITKYIGKSKVVVIPSFVHVIGERAFAGGEIEEIRFGEKSQLSRIKDEAFEGCESLRIIDFTNVEERKISISGTAFDGCYALEEIYGEEKIERIFAGAFKDVDKAFIIDGEFIYPKMWLYNLLNNNEKDFATYDLERPISYKEELPAIDLYNPYVKKTLSYYVEEMLVPVCAKTSYGGTVVSCFQFSPSEDYENFAYELDEEIEVWTEFYLPQQGNVKTFLAMFEYGNEDEDFLKISDESKYIELQREFFEKFEQKVNIIKSQRLAEGKPAVLDFDFATPKTNPTKACADVYFIGGQCYTYNTLVEVKNGDVVYVEGVKEGFLGIVSGKMREWQDGDYMRLITSAYEHNNSNFFEDSYYESTIANVYPETESLRGQKPKRKPSVEKAKKEQKEEKTGFSKCKVRVEFPNGKSYTYNTNLTVNIGDSVKVGGKMSSEIGRVIAYEGEFDKSPYMQKITKVVNASTSVSPEELSKEISNKYWYDKNGKAKTYETINLNNDEVVDVRDVDIFGGSKKKNLLVKCVFKSKKELLDLNNFDVELIEGEIANELWGIYYDDKEVAQVTFIIGTLDVRGHEIDDVNIVAIENEENGKEYDISTLLKITVKACEDEYYGLDWDEEESDE